MLQLKWFIALTLFVSALTPSVYASPCALQQKNITEFFQSNNTDFGPANVEILQRLLRDELTQKNYELTELRGAPYQIRVEYTMTESAHEWVLLLDRFGTYSAPLRFELAEMSLEYAKKRNGKLNAKKYREALDFLTSIAKERFFLALGRIPACQR